MSTTGADFDRFAASYDADLDAGLAVTGEAKDFYARERLAWLGRRLQRCDLRVETILDFGCGQGGTTRLLRDAFNATSVIGVDVSRGLLDVAEAEHGGPGISFVTPDAWPAGLQADLAYSNGVFHHIDPRRRSESLGFISRALRPGGIFALWENNPWNPGTRLVMSRIPFDRDAILLGAGEARGLLQDAGLTPFAVDYAFIFPRALKVFRPLESWLAAWPLGGQYQVLARR